MFTQSLGRYSDALKLMCGRLPGRSCQRDTHVRGAAQDCWREEFQAACGQGPGLARLPGPISYEKHIKSTPTPNIKSLKVHIPLPPP